MSQAKKSSSEPKRAQSPYVGLTPFTEEDAEFFCGRDAEIELVTANLRALRMTLLYGASGVGKSSLINAGVVHRLRRVSRETVSLKGRPDFIVAVFRDWPGDPLARFRTALQEAIRGVGGELSEIEIPTTRDLPQLLATAVSLTGAELLVILDQFEEYLLNPEEGEQEGSFAYQFPRAVGRLDLPVKFLLSMREDAISALDFFQGRIPAAAADPFENRLTIKHLDKQSARLAIVEPVERYNRLFGTGYDVEPELVERVLEDLESTKVQSYGEGQARVGPDAEQLRVETPYLQLVMTRIWEEDILKFKSEDATRTRPRALRLKTLTEKLGGAMKIVENHLEDVMKQLSTADRELAAKFIHFTVTRYGTKIPVNAETLGDFADLPAERRPDIEKILKSLGDKRIFRAVNAPARRLLPARDGQAEPPAGFFEISHDALAPAVLTWRKEYMRERSAKLAAADAKRREEEKHRKRRDEEARKAELERVRLVERQRYEKKIAAVVGLGTILLTVLTSLYQYNQVNVQQEAAVKEEQRKKEYRALADNFQSYGTLLDITLRLGSPEEGKRRAALSQLQDLARANQFPAEYREAFVSLLREAPLPGADAQAKDETIAAINASRGGVQQPAQTFPAILYIHIRNEGQRAQAERLQKTLEDRNYLVPGIQNVGRVGPSSTQVRYFRKADADEAGALVEILKGENIEAAAVPIEGYEDSPSLKDKTLELWFSQG